MSHDGEAVCLCCAEHRPPVLEYEAHHVWPKGMGGPDVPENLVWVCGNTHSNTHELLRHILRAGRPLTDHELSALEERPVSRYAAALAREGYRRFTDNTLLQ